MKTFFSEDLLNSSGGGLSLDVIKAKLSYFELQLAELHWQTTSLAEHLATGDAYDIIFNSKDDIVERIMGYTGVRTKAMPVETIKNYSVGVPEAVVNEILIFAKQLENFGSVNSMPDIENLAQGLSGSFSKIKYRLTLS